MPDEYWLILKGPRFEKLPWLGEKTTYINRYCEWDSIHSYVQELKSRYPSWKINIGVTRGTDIYVLA